METVFAWRTIQESLFKTEVLFRFGQETQRTDLTGWNSMYEDLEIFVTVTSKFRKQDLSFYFEKGEKPGLLLRWFGDNKFSGCSEVHNFVPESSLTINCMIPKGSCLASLECECNVFVRVPVFGEDGQWLRPPGSIVSILSVLEKTSIGKGTWFPVSEYEGDGTCLIHWDFVGTDDLEIALSSALAVAIDKKHPMANGASSNNHLITLMLIQGFVRKAFSPGIFEQLLEKEKHNDKWNTGSLGASFNFVLCKICNNTNARSLELLRDIYLNSPERIDEAIDKIFANVLTLNSNHEPAIV